VADTLQSVFDLPDVSFTDNDTLQAMQERLITNYEARYKAVTGTEISLAPADPIRILLYAVALDLYQVEQYVDRAGKQDLLKYSYGEFLDNLAAGRGVTRQQAAAAKATLRFTLSETRDYAIGIPAGTRVTNGDGVYFQTSEYGEVEAGNLTADIEAECTENGIEGNDLVPGQLNILVDPVAYVEKVSNIDTSSGGTILETDDSLAERVFLAPSSYSVAGPDAAYIYWAKTYNTGIGSVKPTSPNPCEVVIYILMQDGSIPEDGVVNGLQEYLADGSIRPLTDKVTVKTPTVQEFSVEMTYYINRSDSASAVTIQQEVETAVAEYINWQTTEIGKDINPSELIKRVVAAGAKRVEVTSPSFRAVAETEVAQCTGQTAMYGGLEDD
jgi:phage-related baseplate assembly protein